MDNKDNQKGKNIPTLWERKEDCCGCSACYSVCPTGSITMEPDEEGFLYPHIDEGKCVGCRQCIQVCAFKRDVEKKRCNR
jgi:formate hydrogenlyase subunit 6/NADH:ubiquinone oxidoreductase subunit I